MTLRIDKLEPAVFYALVAWTLFPVWAVDFFVTGDGPCHLYNSKVLLDWYEGVNEKFYDPFLFLNTNFEPNWFFNLFTMPLLNVFSPATTEKIFLSFYVLSFTLGFRYLIRQINPNALFISSIGLLFCVHHLLMMGFYNNSVSFALWFWAAGWWWGHRNSPSLAPIAVTALLLLLVYSAHPMGLVFTGLTTGTLLLGLFFYETRSDGFASSRPRFFNRLTGLILSALPALMLFAEFCFRRDWSTETNVPALNETLKNVRRLSALIAMHSTEEIWAKATALTSALLFAGAVVLRLRARRWVAADGLLLFFGVALYCIFFPPASISGGLEVPLRMVMIPFLVILFWSATADFPKWAKMAALSAATVLAIGFGTVRWKVWQEASAYAKEIYACNAHIGNPATILALNYDWAGQNSAAQPIADRIWLFGHVDCYLGASRSAIVSDNYEANYWYFPTIARWNTNMYQQTDKDGINFDHRPPRADILSYKRRTGQEIDYVLLLSFRDEFKNHPHTQEILAQLAEAYDQTFISASGRAILYKRRNL